jgi:hypothetical protein
MKAYIIVLPLINDSIIALIRHLIYDLHGMLTPFILQFRFDT